MKKFAVISILLFFLLFAFGEEAPSVSEAEFTPEKKTPSGSQSGGGVLEESAAAAGNTFYTDSKGRLRLYFSGEEYSYYHSAPLLSSRIISDELHSAQSQYDEKKRLTVKKTWSVTFPGSQPAEITEFFYEGDAIEPHKIVHSDFIHNEYTETLFTDFFLPRTKTVTVLEPLTEADGAKSALDTKKSLRSSEWSYDGQNRLVRESQWEGNTERIWEYAYTALTEKPNTRYYENKILLEEITYIGPDHREETLYLGEASVRSVYIQGKKVAEMYLVDGKTVREKKFEKNN